MEHSYRAGQLPGAVGLKENEFGHGPDVLWLATMRSHDQYNTTLYSTSDRYRGIYNQRDVLFLSDIETKRRSLAFGDRVDIHSVCSDGIERVVRRFKVIVYDIPEGCCGAYYPRGQSIDAPIRTRPGRGYAQQQGHPGPAGSISGPELTVTPSASALPPTFAALTAVFALAYGLIDGCALGAGILFPLLARRADTQPLFDSITLLWGANVLILVSGGILFLTGFPLAYSTLLPMVYVPLLIMLVSLVLRGVGYECQGRNSALQPVWQWSFSLGSIAATLCQGWMLGTIVEGIGAQPDSGELERIVRLLLPLTCSVGLLGGYTLLGSAWLIWKTRGALQVLGREVGFSSSF